MQTIVVAALPLKFGVEVTRQHLREIAWPEGSVPKGAFAKIDELLDGKTRRVALAALEGERAGAEGEGHGARSARLARRRHPAGHEGRHRAGERHQRRRRLRPARRARRRAPGAQPRAHRSLFRRAAAERQGARRRPARRRELGQAGAGQGGHRRGDDRRRAEADACRKRRHAGAGAQRRRRGRSRERPPHRRRRPLASAGTGAAPGGTRLGSRGGRSAQPDGRREPWHEAPGIQRAGLWRAGAGRDHTASTVPPKS